MTKIIEMLEKLRRKFWRMLDKFDEYLFKFWLFLENIKQFWEISKKIINSYNTIASLKITDFDIFSIMDCNYKV